MSSRSADCSRGWMHIGDQRYDTRDVQYLIGLLVDQRVADAKRLGVSGVSLGSLISMEIAFLRDRVRQVDGKFSCAGARRAAFR